MITQNLPALQVVLPLLGAVVCALLRRGTSAWLVALIVSLAMPVVSGLMLVHVLTDGPISYAMGGWTPPWGIEYRVDLLSGFVLMLVSVIGAVIMTYARQSVALEISPDRQPWFYCTYLLCLCGLLGIETAHECDFEVSADAEQPVIRPDHAETIAHGSNTGFPEAGRAAAHPQRARGFLTGRN